MDTGRPPEGVSAGSRLPARGSMNRFLASLSFLLLAQPALFGQSRDETANFIIQEIKSLETKTYIVTEVAFSAPGDVFTFRRRRVGWPDKGLIIPLANADIFCSTYHRADGVNRYTLVVRSRGRDGLITVNGLHYRGTVNLVAMEDERKAKALERAFAHMAALVGGRKELFSPPY